MDFIFKFVFFTRKTKKEKTLRIEFGFYNG